MTRECGSCTLCCYLPDIADLDKPKSKWCQHCEPHVGCKIYEQRPPVCQSFRCMWLDGELSELMRPADIRCYAQKMDDYVRVMAEKDHDVCWPMVDEITEQGLHALIQSGDQITFVCGKDQPRPKAIQLNWTL